MPGIGASLTDSSQMPTVCTAEALPDASTTKNCSGPGLPWKSGAGSKRSAPASDGVSTLRSAIGEPAGV
ncbi:hypothetical protein ABXN37_09745 [Piscinibacter sakaiensis]